MEEKMIIRTRGLARSFKDFKAVNGIDLAVPQGSIYGFLGPNGAGKTTSIRMLLGLIRPTAGLINLFGESSPAQQKKCFHRIGAMVETPSYYPNLTGYENVALIAGMRNLPAQAVKEALAIVDLEKASRRLSRHYSLGMIQRLGLAIALLGKPELLILDEPTNGLDPAGIHEIRQLLQKLPEQYGITVFISSHLLNEVEQIASHIGIIQKGKLIFQGTHTDLDARFAESASLTTDQPEKAQKILQGLGWKAEWNGDHLIRVQVHGETDVALLIDQLVRGGSKIYQAGIQKMSLEDIFLTLTGEKL